MTITPKQQAELQAIAQPVMNWLFTNGHPHISIAITSDRAEICEGIAAVVSNSQIAEQNQVVFASDHLVDGYRKWHAREVPIGARLRPKSTAPSDLFGCATITEVYGDTIYHGRTYNTAWALLNKFEHSPIGSREWFPCGFKIL